MDFTTRKNKLDFTVDGEPFQTKKAVAAGVLFKLQGTFSKLGNDKANAGKEREEAYEELKSVYDKILTKEAWQRFEPRIEGTCPDGVVPIDMMKLIEITQWLIGEGLGKDLTQQPDSSQAG
jgi:hypothetical protein